MYKAIVNNISFDIENQSDDFIVNGEAFQWNLSKISEGYFHILHQQKSYRAEVVKLDAGTKTFTIKINGRTYPVELKDRFDMLLEKMGMNSQSSAKINNIKAPMPGLIIDLKVKEDDIVNAGDVLLILEAMKMENIIKSPGEGIVKSLKVKKGDSVEKGQVLIEF
ncbi:MAG TPA: biotin/lipoyl-binding protein [Chryseolinea sp.]|nr:biotin/lipoyl-binding protein [Chryseolinea sp.]HPH47552.1 biotin/lipoyl-binding protein [Chryseolinea sp.]HPM28706.1 biotin/lipoyl-binding protein [Chryseolinea sp.]